MNWLREAINDSATGLASSKRVVMVMAGFAMAVGVVILCIAAMWGTPVSGELAAVCVPLAGMSGYSYVQGQAKP